MTRKPAEAVNRHLRTLQQAVSCVTDSVLWVDGRSFRADGYRITFRSDSPVPLRGPLRLTLRLDEYFRLGPGARDQNALIVIGYLYSVAHTDEREVISYHWHPAVLGAEYPHLHIGHGAVQAAILDRAGLSPAHNALLPELAGAHLPTGAVELNAVLRMAIEHLGVEPRRGDWASLLR